MDDKTICLTCTLPDCDEDDPRCPRQFRPYRSKWQDQIDRVAALAEGERVILDAVPAASYRSLQSSLSQAARKRRFGFQIRTRSHRTDSDRVEVEVWRSDQVRGRHWSHWTERIDRAFALQPGEECEFTMSTPTDLGRLQNALYRRATRTGVLIETWRTHGEHLVLHVRKCEQ